MSSTGSLFFERTSSIVSSWLSGVCCGGVQEETSKYSAFVSADDWEQDNTLSSDSLTNNLSLRSADRNASAITTSTATTTTTISSSYYGSPNKSPTQKNKKKDKLSLRIQNVEAQITVHNSSRQHYTGQKEVEDCRRRKICNEPIHVDQNFQPPVFPKSDNEYQFLKHALQEHFIFSDLTEDECDHFIKAMQYQEVKPFLVKQQQQEHPSDNDDEKKESKKMERLSKEEKEQKEAATVIHQGEPGDFFYILQEGTIAFEQNGQNVGSCQPGVAFGELALLYNSPRAASCIAVVTMAEENNKNDNENAGVVKLWKVDRHTFRHILASRVHCHHTTTIELLKSISIFQNLDCCTLTQFVDAMTAVKWQPSDRIVQKGDEGNVFYIIQEGKVRIHDIGLGDSQFDDQILGPGDWFGERALLTGEVRAANVTALTKTTTLAIDRETFETVIGPLKNFMEEEMRKRFLRTLPFFAQSDITEPELSQLAVLMLEVCFRKGAAIAKAGEPFEYLYIIRSGAILVSGNKKEDGNMFKLQTGDYFGDETLSGNTDGMNSRNAVCEEELTAWILSHKDIECVLGDLDRLGAHKGLGRNLKNHSSAPTIRLEALKRVRLLGQGGFGKVWLVRYVDEDTKESTPFALKMISKRRAIDSKQATSIIRERNLLGMLKHPFILDLVAAYKDTYYLYLLMPVVPGGELFSVLRSQKEQGRGMSNDNAAFYSACTIEALGHFHQRFIAYRDLKLENVMIDADGYCKIIDLGFAKVVLNKTYTLCGTPEYVAPELIMSKGHDKAVDYWSFGVLTYELLVGVSPFWRPHSKQIDLFKRIVRGDYSIPEFVSPSARKVIKGLLKRSPLYRLGNQSKGYLDIKNSIWYSESGINFVKLLKKEITAPWIPNVKDPFKTSISQDHIEGGAPPEKELTDHEESLFDEF